MKKLIIYGTGAIAEVAHTYFTADSDYEVVAFTNAAEFISGDEDLPAPLVPFEELASSHPPGEHDLFIAVGYNKTNTIRQQRFDEAKAMGYQCATYIASGAHYYDTPVGENCFILENNVVQPFVKIGDNVTLWSGNHIGHHSVIQDHCFIASHVVVSGNCTVEHHCFLGVNATLRDGITLGASTVVGSGAIVMNDTEPNTLVRPAESNTRVVRRHVI